MSLHPAWRRALAPVLLLVLTTPAWADSHEAAEDDWFPGEFTANVGFTTDYVFRGISQTNEHGAVQGGIDYGLDLGEYVSFYVGGWGSNVNFGDGDEAQVEIDVYGGLTGTIGNFSWDVTSIWYEYPGADNDLDYDFWEFGPSVGYDFGVASVSAGYLWSPEFLAQSGDGHWFYGGVEVPMPEDAMPSWLGLAFSGNVAHQAIDKDSVFGVPDYMTWDAGATLSAFGLDFDIRYFDTDISRDSCFGGGSSAGDLCAERIVGTISKSF